MKKVISTILVIFLLTSFCSTAIAATTTSKNISLYLSGGSAIGSILVSNYSNYSNAKSFSNNTTARWDICFALPSCEAGNYTVYLRYLDTDGATIYDLSKNYTLKDPIIVPKKVEQQKAADILAVDPLPEIIPEPVIAPVIIPKPKVSFLDKTQKVLSSPETQKTLQDTATTFAITQAVATPFLAFAPTLSGSSLLVLPLRIWNFLLVLFGLRKRRKSWGIVYDSLSKQPLDPVVVTLKDGEGKEISTSITDMDGRYGFFVEEGSYTISAGKGKYSFPSEILGGQTYDPIYDNLYYGEELNLAKDSVITKNIPMDPVGVDWNQQEKMRTKRGYTTEIVQLVARATNVLFFIGFATSIVSLVLHQTILNIILLSVYIILGLIRRAGFAPRIYGAVSIGETPLANGVLRFWNDSGVQISKAITDSMGRYYALVPTGNYRMSVEISDTIGGLKPYVSGIEIAAKAGVINQKIELPEI